MKSVFLAFTFFNFKQMGLISLLFPALFRRQKPCVYSPLPILRSCLRFTSSDRTSPAFQWLISKGISENVVVGIMKSFPSPPTISELKSFGDTGLKELVESVKREQQKKWSTDLDQVTIHVKIPKINKEITLKGLEGQSFYDLKLEHEDLSPYIECACGGIAACSTCHVYIGDTDENSKEEDPYFRKLPPPDDAEMDMLDLAWGYNPHASRLGCQLKLNKTMEGMTATLPKEINNLYSRAL
jgi:ferredoxin